MARIIQHDDVEEIAKAVEQLKAGGLVAFPTETVYGLGAHALDKQGAGRVFEVKGRPASDPLIVHVLGWEDAKGLVVGTGRQMEIAETLAGSIWPGPLTMVLPAADKVPSLITANSGWVGVRSPNHPVARMLLEKSGLPIAAPSANRFNHVSPTLPEHVIEDLGERDPSLIVINGGASDVGIESTVVKVHDDARLEILRRGAVTSQQLKVAVAALGYDVGVVERDTRAAPKKVVEEMEGPGQMLTHYAPNLPAYLCGGVEGGVVRTEDGDEHPLADVIIVDYNSQKASLQRAAHAYRDLSPTGLSSEAAASLFSTLRWTEVFPSAKIVLLPLIPDSADEVLAAVQDRLFRAASGKTAK